ncbi:MAG: hypothetical protein ABSH20_26675, partial [Tepidisphaeraceae bacterium]
MLADVPRMIIGVVLLTVLVLPRPGRAEPVTPSPEITIQGSLLCDGACMPRPTPDEHMMVIYAIDGTPQIRAELQKIMKDFYPDRGLDADAADKLMAQFTERLKYHLSPQSPALASAGGKAKNHYCPPAEAQAVTGVVVVKDGKRWITASRIEPARLKYPERMLAPDKPFVMPEGPPLVLKIGQALTLKCVPIPAGRFLMGTPFYMW